MLQTSFLPQFQFRGESLVNRVAFSGNLQAFIAQVPLFKGTGVADVNMIAQNMEIRQFQPGTQLFKAGDPGDCFFIVCSGEAEVRVPDHSWLKVGHECELACPTKIAGVVYPKGSRGIIDKFDSKRGYPYTFRTKDNVRGRVADHELVPLDKSLLHEDKTIAILRQGDYFGEQAVLRSAHRNATIVARTNAVAPLICGVLSKERFHQLDLGHKVAFPRRKAIMAVDDGYEERLAPRDTTKTVEQVEFIRQAILRNKVIHDLVDLTDADLNAMVRIAYKVPVETGNIIIHEGDLFATEFFVVESGAFEFHVANKNGSEHDKIFQFSMMSQCKSGGSFGELALLYHAPREATVTCAEPGLVWVVDRVAFKNVLHATRRSKLIQYIQVFHNISIFNCLLADEKEALAECLYEKHYIKGETICKSGEMAQMFFIVVAGEIQIDGQKYDTQVHKGFFFGEECILRGTATRHTLIAVSEDVVIACLSKNDFERLLGPLEDLLLHSTTGKPRRSRLDVVTPEMGKIQDIKMSSLKRIGMLGCGGFGAVTLEQHTQTGKCYALKQISKAYILKCKMQKSVMNEKRIQLMCNSDFIIRLYCTYNTKDSLWLLLEPGMGGELYHTYHKKKFHGHADKARFYAAATIMAFAHLHERQVIYRDLKPENLLLDHEGRCKLTDMGLAKQTSVKTYTMCGTPDYFAPEIVAPPHGHTQAVDWWTLGVLIHELMCGHAPFEASSPPQIYAKIRRGIVGVNFTYQGNDPLAVEIVKCLLQQDPNARLPMQPGGIENLQTHAWYGRANFQWRDFANKTMTVPYKAEIKGPTDLSNFKQRNPEDLPKHFKMDYVDPGDGWDKDF